MTPQVAAGQKYGRLTVVAPNSRDRWAHQLWLCRCECGNTVVVRLRSGRSGTFSCGCLRRELATERNRARRRHGETCLGERSPEYISWNGIIQRCTNPTHVSYAYYGGRGITMCNRWAESFEAFLADVGRRPSPSHSIDRINNDGNYEPGNCRWATRAEQARNRRRGVRRHVAPVRPEVTLRGEE